MTLVSQQDSPEQAISADSSQDAPPTAIPSNAWESALQAWETVLPLAPDHPVARVQRIECLVRLKRWDAVVEACTAEHALAVDDELRFASRLSAGQAFDRALPLWERIAARADTDEQALTAVRAQLRCFAKLGLRGRKPIVGRLAPWVHSADPGRRQANARPRHIAVLGVSYCGSTVLSLVLGALPGVANIGESHWLVEPRTDKSREAHHLTEEGFEQCVFCGPECPVITHDLRRRLAARPAAFHQILAAALGTDILVSADKNYSHMVRRDPDLHHDAILVFRDPLDNWRSQARRSAAIDTDARIKYLRQWSIDYSNFLVNYPNTGRKIVLDFDDFLARPDEMLQRICQALDLPYTEDGLQYWRHRQHCVGGNINVRERIISEEFDALRIKPGARTSAQCTDQADGRLPGEVRSVAKRLRAASLRAPHPDRWDTGLEVRSVSGVRALVAAGHSHLLSVASLVAPDSPKLAKRRSRLLWRRGDRLGAVAVIEQALTVAPGEERLHREFARVASRLATSPWAQDHPESVVDVLGRALSISPRCPTLRSDYIAAVAGLARQKRVAGDAAGALDLLERALPLAGTPPDLAADYARLVRAEVRTRRSAGDLAGAVDLLEHGLGRLGNPADLLAAYALTVASLARSRRKAGDLAGALRVAERAIARVGDDPQLLAIRASILHDQSRHRDALAAWRQLAERAPLEPAGWVGMARAMHALDRWDEIEGLIESYLRLLAERPDRYLRAAKVALAVRRATTFEALLAQAAAEADGDARRLAEIAALHGGAGHLGELLNCLDQLPEPVGAQAAQRQEALRALRLVGIDAESLRPAERAGLRMPDLAFLTLIGRSSPPGRPAAAKRVVMVYTSLGAGGAERQLANTVRGLSASGATPDIWLMPTRDRDPATDRFHAARLDDLPITIAPCAEETVDLARLQAVLGPEAGDLLALLPAPLRREVGVLATRFLRERPAVVHAWSDYRNVSAGVAAALAGVPRIVLGGRNLKPPRAPHYFRAVYCALLDRPGIILLNNSQAGAHSYTNWLALELSRIRVIYNGVDVEALEGARDAQATAAHRAHLGLPADARVVGTAFRLGGVKRPLLWVRAAAEVARRDPKAHFVIVGGGPLRAETQALAHELGLAQRLHMPGLTRQVVPWFELMDVVLLTSEREGTSNTALEAQALGIPVVSPAVGGMPEALIPDVSGFLVDPDPSPEAIAERVVQALTDQEWRNQARPAAQAFIRERFSLERMIRDTLQIYDLPALDGMDELRPDWAESGTGQVA